MQHEYLMMEGYLVRQMLHGSTPSKHIYGTYILYIYIHIGKYFCGYYIATNRQYFHGFEKRRCCLKFVDNNFKYVPFLTMDKEENLIKSTK